MLALAFLQAPPLHEAEKIKLNKSEKGPKKGGSGVHTCKKLQKSHIFAFERITFGGSRNRRC